jgi:hypothetical protein
MASTSASKRQPCQNDFLLPVESNVAASLYRTRTLHQASIRFPFPNQPSSSQRKLINNNNRINSNKRYCIPIISLHPILSPFPPRPPSISPGIGENSLRIKVRILVIKLINLPLTLTSPPALPPPNAGSATVLDHPTVFSLARVGLERGGGSV